MKQRIYCLGLLSLLACSAAGGGTGARIATPAGRIAEPVSASAVNPQASASTAQSPPAPAVLHEERDDASERDRAFIDNAERAIAQYSEFLARAGDGPEYASAVKRSREQIDDLRLAIEFVRAGAAQRAAH